MSGSAELGRAGVSEDHPLQQPSKGRTLCGLGAAEALRGRNTRRVPVAAPLTKWKWRPVETICDFQTSKSRKAATLELPLWPLGSAQFRRTWSSRAAA